MVNTYQIYLISDSTGETLDRIFLAIKAQFKNIKYKIQNIPTTITQQTKYSITEPKCYIRSIRTCNFHLDYTSKKLAFYNFFKFITSPIGTSFTIINKQNIAFYLTIVSLALRFLVIFYFIDTVSSLLWAITLSASTYYVVYHIFVYRLLMKISKL